MARRHPLWRKWTYIRQVINNPNCPCYNPDLECEGLNNFTEFQQFVRDEIGRAQPDRPILHRKNGDLGWIPGNITWGTQTEVAKTSGYSHRIRYRRREYTAREFCRLLGINPMNFLRRLRLGQSIESITGLKNVGIEYGNQKKRSV